METITPNGEVPLALLSRCGGYYECPKDIVGKRLGPLVGYAGKDKSGKQFVGDIYANFAKAERHTPVLWHFAGKLRATLMTVPGLTQKYQRSAGFCGAPEGGKALAISLAHLSGKQYIFPEKKVTALATKTSREESTLVFDRHEPEEGEGWWIVEDVCNNFSTTYKLIELIQSFKASVCGILCFLNRSLTIDDVYIPMAGVNFPVVSVERIPIPQYGQNDPAVAEDVASLNVVWKPKNDWSRLAKAMAAHR